MTIGGLALASLRYYRRTHAAVVLGVAGAVAVLAGSFLVGTSVRASLASIAAGRLGETSIVVAAEQPFTEALSDRLGAGIGAPVAPLLSLSGIVRHEASGRSAGNVSVYGVDARFFAFHGVDVAAPGRTDLLMSADLAAEFGAAEGDAVIVRLARPTDIPLDSLHGRRDDIGRSIRLTMRQTLGRDAMGEFSLAPGQGPARAVFVALSRLQRDLELESRANAILVGRRDGLTAEVAQTALGRAVTIDDLGIRVTTLDSADAVLVESASGLVPESIAARVNASAAREGRGVTPVLSWLANRMTAGNRTVPYSLVTAIGPDAGGDAALAALLAWNGSDPAPAVLTEWTARDLAAAAGDTLELEYYRWADEGRLVSDRATFRIAGIVPMRGLAIDRRLAPDYPGITSASNFSEWDPPFPIDLRLVRPQDEAFWDEYRTAPKAFIPLAAGQSLWRTRYGQLTSLRVTGTGELLNLNTSEPEHPRTRAPENPRTREPENLRTRGPENLTVAAVRSQADSASVGATDFGAYFSYFSFFLMVAAVLLAALFFRLSIEQRLPQIGVLRAGGWSTGEIRRAFLLEGSAVAAAGAALGALLAVAWAALMMYALRTWWVDAVGTTRLELHVSPLALAGGAIGAAVAALASIALTVRALGRSSPRSQMAGALPQPSPAARTRARWIAPLAIAAAVLLSALSLGGVIADVGGFFGAGALVLVGGLAAFRTWLGGPRGPRRTDASGVTSLGAFGLRNAGWRPGRSLTAAGLVAAAVFLLVSVDSFRKSVTDADARDSGTGGFALIAESSLPIVHDLQTREGRDDVGLPATLEGTPLEGVTLYGLRLRPGDDASCLNLYQPKQPRVVGVPDRLIDEGRFRFARTAMPPDADDATRANPWRLLGAPDDAGVVPAIVDQTSLQYVLHAAVGDVITIDADTSRPIRVRIVASLRDAVLQGEILIAETAFRQIFPNQPGYRVFLVDVAGEPASRADAVSTALEQALQPFGFDAQSTARRLAAYHRVENTYLSTFQALGGLGLMLGCLGLVAVIARNVLERRRELALLGAAGFTGRDLQQLVAIEHLALVGAGLAIGVIAAALAIAPVVVERGGGLPWSALVWLAPVSAAGLAAAYGSTRGLRRLPLVASLRSE